MQKAKMILLVDDDADDRMVFQDALKEIDSSIVCATAGNGEEALTALKKNSILPDIIFLDMNMPKMGGKECLTLLKKDKRLQHIPVIMYTTSKQVEDRQECQALGCAEFLTKPQRYHELRKVIHDTIDDIFEQIKKVSQR